jgi:hypothetical protein
MNVYSKKELRNTLKSNIVQVTFTKIDGSTRVMNCTLSEKFLPSTSSNTENKKVNDNVFTVWDTDVNNWRAFRYDSVNKAEVIND